MLSKIKVFISSKRAFTLLELVMTIAIIGVLVMGMTVYIGGSDEKRKVIEAQGCASTIGGELTNYIFYALTSKSLRNSDGNLKSPDFYYISLSGDSAFDLFYTEFVEDGGTKVEGSGQLYKHLTVYNACRTNNARIRFNWTGNNLGDDSKIKINKGFTPVKLSEDKIFYIQNGSNKELLGDIIINLCIDASCTKKKEIAKYAVDGRTQTISLKNCAFYSDNNNTCKTREGCRVYSDTDITACEEY